MDGVNRTAGSKRGNEEGRWLLSSEVDAVSSVPGKVKDSVQA